MLNNSAEEQLKSGQGWGCDGGGLGARLFVGPRLRDPVMANIVFFPQDLGFQFFFF